ncbi:MAG: MBL fold metallo-hydrolase [Verrucomicrobia bacterium]|nr:MBL fold metallo-hydrolase [Verrucomicrobiota bacterium]
MASRTTALLIDAGLSARETTRRLAEIDVDVSSVGGICISHEHNDHIQGIRVLHNKHAIPVYANTGTIEGLRRDPKLAGLPWQVFSTGYSFQVGNLTVEPFSVPHDAYDPVGFVISCDHVCVGIVTDIGMVTNVVRERLRNCHAVVLEANHDENMLKDAPRPWYLKQRISGRQGHLSNRHAAEFLAEIASPLLEKVFLAHLSNQCNTGELALSETHAGLARTGRSGVSVSLTFPDHISELWEYDGIDPQLETTTVSERAKS